MNKIQLKDGRFISYEEYGNPKGKPAFYFHGWPASSLSAKPLENAAKKLNIRIISLDRPGYGFSTYQKNRSLLDWPKDVLEISKIFKINRFSIIGSSGGGPYVLVCAYKIPNKISTAIISAGLGPLFELKNSRLSLIQKMYLISWSVIYRLSLPILIIYFLAIKYWPDLYFRLTNIGRSKTDQTLLKKYGLRQMVILNAKHAFRKNIKGPWQDLKIYSRYWGFELNSITKLVKIWHGQKDKSVPFWFGKYVARTLPKCQAHYLKNSGHLLLLTHAVTILSDI